MQRQAAALFELLPAIGFAVQQEIVVARMERNLPWRYRQRTDADTRQMVVDQVPA